MPTRHLTVLPPLSLYIHLPWCVRKCPYCDFNSHTLKTDLPEEAYIDALIADLIADLPRIHERSITSIFFGGGTPSLFSAAALARLLHEIGRRVPLATDCEITLEANPGTAEQARFDGFRQAGINRLSLGIQSFEPAKLHALGRIHDGEQAQSAITMAERAGFCRINIDLMYGLPQQTLAQALADIDLALSFGVTHLSWYQLTLEPNTPFHRQPPPLPSDETLWQMHQAGQQRLQMQGLLPYEVSAFSQVGAECRHNRNYWQFGDYLGIGAGAHSKITTLTTQTVTRFWKIKHPKAYLSNEATKIAEESTIDDEALVFEFMLNALRLYQPIPQSLFQQRTGLPLQQLAQPLSTAYARGLLTEEADHWQVTPLGRRFLNDVMELFLL